MRLGDRALVGVAFAATAAGVGVETLRSGSAAPALVLGWAVLFYSTGLLLAEGALAWRARR
jgi:hypothetical protein